MKLPSHGALPTWLWAGSELIQLVKESRSHCSDPNRERDVGWCVRERERDPNPGTVHWASILTCFKTTCFIRPSAVNKPSWKRAASEQRAYCASLSAHTTADWRSPCLFLVFFYALLSFWSCLYILTDFPVISTFKYPHEVRSALRPRHNSIMQLWCRRWPWLWILWIGSSQCSLQSAATVHLVVFCFLWCSIDPWGRNLSLLLLSSPHSTSFTEVLQYFNMWVLNRTCHMLQFSRTQVKRDDYVTQTFSDVANPFAH